MGLEQQGVLNGYSLFTPSLPLSSTLVKFDSERNLRDLAVTQDLTLVTKAMIWHMTLGLSDLSTFPAKNSSNSQTVLLASLLKSDFFSLLPNLQWSYVDLFGRLKKLAAIMLLKLEHLEPPHLKIPSLENSLPNIPFKIRQKNNCLFAKLASVSKPICLLYTRAKIYQLSSKSIREEKCMTSYHYKFSATYITNLEKSNTTPPQ